MSEINNNNFIIFLDIDGVLWSYDKRKHWDEDGKQSFIKEAVESLNKIIEYYDADLCMISGWNSGFGSEKDYKDFLTSRGIIVNNLIFGSQHSRYKFVLNTIKEEDLKWYLIIDDEAYGYYELMPAIEYKRILQPNRYRCLDLYDVKQVTKNFKLKV